MTGSTLSTGQGRIWLLLPVLLIWLCCYSRLSSLDLAAMIAAANATSSLPLRSSGAWNDDGSVLAW